MKSNLTIGVISYNRPEELARCISSLLPLEHGVEVIICDDKSPKIKEIKNLITPFLDLYPQISFIENKVNLGYDRNLYNTIKLANSTHILLLGDDDMLEEGSAKNILEYLNNNNVDSGFLRFREYDPQYKFCSSDKLIYQRSYGKSRYFKNDEVVKSGSYTYNSILFSGLIFKTKSVEEVNSFIGDFFNSIYIQVSIFVYVNTIYGGHYINGPGVITGSDGESGFGLNQSAKVNEKDLVNRNSTLSKLNYHVRLLDVINKMDSITNLSISKSFSREYKIRGVKLFYNTRKNDPKQILNYFRKSMKLKLKNKWKLLFIFIIISIIPIFIMEPILMRLEKLIMHRRNLIYEK